VTADIIRTGGELIDVLDDSLPSDAPSRTETLEGLAAAVDGAELALEASSSNLGLMKWISITLRATAIVLNLLKTAGLPIPDLLVSFINVIVGLLPTGEQWQATELSMAYL
jgi:hypothetical protein